MLVVAHRQQVAAAGDRVVEVNSDGYLTMNRPSAVSRRQRDLLAASGLLGPRLPRLLAAVALGVVAGQRAGPGRGARPGITGRQMPPALDLPVAVVAVRRVRDFARRAALPRATGHPRRVAAAGRARTPYSSPAGPLTGGTPSAATAGTCTRRRTSTNYNMLVRALAPIAAAVLVVAAAVVAAVRQPPWYWRSTWLPALLRPGLPAEPLQRRKRSPANSD